MEKQTGQSVYISKRKAFSNTLFYLACHVINVLGIITVILQGESSTPIFRFILFVAVGLIIIHCMLDTSERVKATFFKTKFLYYFVIVKTIYMGIMGVLGYVICILSL